MPLNVGRFYASIILVLSAFIAAATAQVVPQVSPSPSSSPAAPPVIQPIANAPTAAEVMRARISKAKAFIAVRNYNAAVYELESIRRETSDTSVQSVTNVLLMNSYLEQGDYKRAQAFLNDFYNQQKTTRPNALASYMTVAGQVVRGARNQVERYRSLGLTVTDRNLPLEALNDLEKMRETVEIVITQAKEMGSDKVKSASALGLLEEATNSRAMIARDDYDAKRWRDAVADSREQMASSRSIITNAVDGTTESSIPTTTVALTTNTPGTLLPVVNNPVFTAPPVETKPKPSETLIASNDKSIVETPKKVDDKKVDEKPAVQAERSRIIAGAPELKKDDTPRSTGPLDVGSLIAYATKQSSPVYPAAAKTIRASGVVKVEVTVDEEGNVAEVQKTSGPALLQGSAKDAIRKWKFKPFVVDGQPVKATGFINFNFSL
ncbi:MAG TPA: TonB family protein [Pyrinomonadaceae bacterium]|nr:TonB family protein [Pyrinomonadaceae bacterium]